MATELKENLNGYASKWTFDKPVLMSGGGGYAMWVKGNQALSTHQKGTGWLANLYGGAQSGDDWASCYIPVNEMPITELGALQWSWYQTATETMGLGVIIWIHDPTDFDKRAEVSQVGGVSGLDKAAGWNSHEFSTSTTQMFFYGEGTTGTGLTAGTQYTWDEFRADTIFKNWTIYRISFDWGWEASGTFESAYLSEVKINGTNIPIRPDASELVGIPYSDWVSFTVADDGTLSAECDLGAPYKYVTVLNPTIDSAAMTAQGAMTSGGTYYPIHHWNDSDADGTVAQSTTAGTTSMAVTYFLGGFRYIKIGFGAAQNGGPYTLYARGLN